MKSESREKCGRMDEDGGEKKENTSEAGAGKDEKRCCDAACAKTQAVSVEV